MSQRAYSLVVMFFLCLTIAFHLVRNPVGDDFVRFFVPAILLLNSLLWFILSKKIGWKVLGFGTSFAVYAFLCLYYLRSTAIGFADFGTFLFLAIVGFNISFWLVASDPRARTISTTVGLTTLFVILVGVFLITHSVHNLGLSNGRFLLLSPLFAMFLAVHAATYKWRVLTQVTFICIIAQIGMGLLDVGEANNIAWMSVSAGVVGLGVLGLIAYWANDLNKWLSPD